MIAFACVGEASGAPALATDPQPQSIVGGEATEEGEFEDVVQIHSFGSGPCSGVVVAPRVVLTAAHCLDELRSTDVVRVEYGTDASAEIDAIGAGSHPAYDRGGGQDIHDYGYVLLGTDFAVPGGYIPPITRQDEWDEAMVEGREVTIVGYGDDGTGETDIKRKVTTTIRRFSDEGLEFYAGGEGLDSCVGDSGGPAYVRIGDGSLRLAGLTSRGEDCGDGGWYGVPYPALCWVDEHTSAGLSDAACNTCDCLDTRPPDIGGCSMIGPDHVRWPWLAIVLFAGRRRTMRASSMPRTGGSDGTSPHWIRNDRARRARARAAGNGRAIIRGRARAADDRRW